MDTQAKCELCGEPMPEGETMFKFHGYSGPCPKPPLQRPNMPKIQPSSDAEWRAYYEDKCRQQMSELAAANEKIKQAERERDEVKLIHDLKQVALEELQEVSERERDQLAAENAKLREALEPDLAGRDFDRLLENAADFIYACGEGPLVDCLRDKAGRVRAALAQAPDAKGEAPSGEPRGKGGEA